MEVKVNATSGQRNIDALFFLDDISSAIVHFTYLGRYLKRPRLGCATSLT